MALAFYLVPYALRIGTDRPTRYCQMDDFTSQITADGGTWSEVEVLGNHAIVKVRASAATHVLIDAQFQRIPVSRLDDPLNTLTTNQLLALRNKVVALGYSLPEINAALGSDLSLITLGQLLRFIASRRLKPRYDAGTDKIMLDGPVQVCESVDALDRRIGGT